uniref:ATP synthase subunit a n=1 Tax=Arbanatus sp. TaxID=2931282 RepID=A0A8T9ZYM3_9HEMI|nr:ATPase subunit 6 [Arbanatus sp.]
MMTNLFSAFDPATSTNLSLNWLSSTLFIFILPSPYWAMHNQLQMMFKKLANTLTGEFYMLINKKSPITLIFFSLFFFLLINNSLGLLPYIYTSSSQLIFSLSMALPMWFAFMLFGWIKNTTFMLAHLVPAGTPALLMPFMVCIETISNLIRPGSLAVRLTANMIAGHLLMTLLGNNTLSVNSMIVPLIMMVQLGLMWFEAAVAIIQSYVFTVLGTLYSSEVI